MSVQSPRVLARVGKHGVALLLAVLILVFGLAGVAYSVFTGGRGGPISLVLVRTSTNATSTSSTTYVDLPGASVPLGVPAGQRALVTARFTAESACSGTGGWCSVRILADGTEMNPASGVDFAFDTPTSGGVSDGWEGNAMERSIVLPAGVHTIKVQYGAVGTGISMRLDDWHLTVERSKNF